MGKMFVNEVLNIKEMSEYLRMPVSTVYKLTEEGRLPSIKIGKHWRYMKKDLAILFQQLVPKAKDAGEGDHRSK
jgi:excisionase family DNA binding protein